MLMQTLCRFAPRRHRVYRLISRLAPDRFEIYRVEGALIYLNLHEIDVQELEIEVLRGAARTLRANPQLIMFLDVPKRLEMRRTIAELLAPYGYTYFPECNEQSPTREILPAGFEVATIRI